MKDNQPDTLAAVALLFQDPPWGETFPEARQENRRGGRQERRWLRTSIALQGWSGCPNACGNHAVADLGILGKKARIDGQVVAAADIFRNGRLGDPGAVAPVKIRENVPCDQLPAELARLAGELGG